MQRWKRDGHSRPQHREVEGATEVRSNDASRIVSVKNVDMRLEVVVIPVSDVDRAKQFYRSLGWRLDADVATGDDFRLIQFTPPGSGCSIQFGKNVISAAAARLRTCT